MSEIIPPSEPVKEPPTLPTQIPDPNPPMSKKFCAFLGFLLFVGSGVLSIVVLPACLLGLIVAIGSLFFKGYRFIFVGYILTIGVLLLGMIIYCSNHPFEDR